MIAVAISPIPYYEFLVPIGAVIILMLVLTLCADHEKKADDELLQYEEVKKTESKVTPVNGLKEDAVVIKVEEEGRTSDEKDTKVPISRQLSGEMQNGSCVEKKERGLSSTSTQSAGSTNSGHSTSSRPRQPSPHLSNPSLDRGAKARASLGDLPPIPKSLHEGAKRTLSSPPLDVNIMDDVKSNKVDTLLDQGNVPLRNMNEPLGRLKETSGNNEGSPEFSGSGSGDATYAKVKDVRKNTEEAAYLVVDLKGRDSEYEIVDGKLVRKTKATSVHLTNRSSIGSGLYEKVTGESRIENGRHEGNEALVPEKDYPGSIPAKDYPTEDSGNSGFYASVRDSTPRVTGLAPSTPAGQTAASGSSSGSHPAKGRPMSHIDHSHKKNPFSRISIFKQSKKRSKSVDDTEGVQATSPKPDRSAKYQSSKSVDPSVPTPVVSSPSPDTPPPPPSVENLRSIARDRKSLKHRSSDLSPELSGRPYSTQLTDCGDGSPLSSPKSNTFPRKGAEQKRIRDTDETEEVDDTYEKVKSTKVGNAASGSPNVNLTNRFKSSSLDRNEKLRSENAAMPEMNLQQDDVDGPTPLQTTPRPESVPLYAQVNKERNEDGKQKHELSLKDKLTSEQNNRDNATDVDLGRNDSAKLSDTKKEGSLKGQGRLSPDLVNNSEHVQTEVHFYAKIRLKNGNEPVMTVEERASQHKFDPESDLNTGKHIESSPPMEAIKEDDVAQLYAKVDMEKKREERAMSELYAVVDKPRTGSLKFHFGESDDREKTYEGAYSIIQEDENRKSAAEEGHEYESVTRQEDENMKKFAIQKDRTAPVKSQRVSVSDDTYEQVRDFRT